MAFSEFHMVSAHASQRKIAIAAEHLWALCPKANVKLPFVYGIQEVGRFGPRISGVRLFVTI
jgi:hypothetical protein